MDVPSYFMRRPALSFSDADTENLERFYEQLTQGEDAVSPVPIWQFLCWAAEHRPILLHGSGDPNITEFEPRQSNDIEEFGNRKAVYAASDGVWAMFFAVVDRVKFRMTISNAAPRLEQNGVTSDPVYFFAMTDHVLAQRPFRTGFVYLLPKQGFQAQASYWQDGFKVHTQQWANLQPVRPIARVTVHPEDFPFLHQIRAQNDDVLAERIERNPNGFPWVDEQEPQ